MLSRAAKRKERKAVLKKALPTESPAKKEKKEGQASRPLKRENSIWVGNLSYKTTPESLRRFFDGVGEVTRVHLPTKLGKASPGDPARRENRGFAYVDFATPEAKNAAILMSESHLEGRRLLIKDGGNFDGRPVKPGVPLDSLPVGARGRGHSKYAQKILFAQKQPPAPTLFFGNLGFETTVESIRGLLEAHRTKEKEKEKSEAVSSESVNNDDGANDPWIRKIRMGTFEDSGLCKGFAFVDFTSIEHATAALIHPKNHQLDGRKLVVEYASADAVRRGGGAGHKPRKKSTEVHSEGRSRRKTRDSVVDDQVNEKGSTTTTTTTPSNAQEEKSTPAADRRSDTFAKSKVTNGTRTWKSKSSRPTPGAALALAKREQVAIVPSQGRRITFDE